MKGYTDEQIKTINATALAVKHNCSSTYVLQVLKGKKSSKSELAQKILADAEIIIPTYQPNA